MIREFFGNSFAFYATGIANTKKSRQLKEFHRALMKYGSTETSVPKDWFDALARLQELLDAENIQRDYQSGKVIVFLDELPWMDAPRSDFKQALEWFWNSYASSRKDLLFIICGSATSWIIDNILGNTGGLYNRVTRRMHLMPFSLHECEMYFQNRGFDISRHQIVECYMVFGGIPYYLNCLSPRLSLAQNIDYLLFSEYGQLKQEFDLLYASLFKKPALYIETIRCLAKHKSGMSRSDLLEESSLSTGGTATIVLSSLEQCGFIRKFHNFAKSKTDYCYQLIDPFTLFYLDVIENRNITSWISFIDSPGYYNWAGLAFEKVCLLHTKQMKTKLGIAGLKTSELSWRSKETSPGAQIDLMIDRADQAINLCEAKFAKDKYTISASEERNLTHKKETFREETGTEKALFLTMITSYGLVKNAHWQIVANELTESDLFIE